MTTPFESHNKAIKKTDLFELALNFTLAQQVPWYVQSKDFSHTLPYVVKARDYSSFWKIEGI